MGMPITPMVRFILILNVLVFFITSMLNLDLTQWLAMHHIQAQDFKPFQLFTYMFLHNGLWHIFGNMLGIYIFGSVLERVWGTQRFTFFYIASGIGAALLYVFVNYLEFQGLENEIYLYLNNPKPEHFSAIVSTEFSGIYPKLYDFIEGYMQNPESPQYIKLSKEYLLEMYQQTLNIPMVGASGALFGVLVAFAVLFPNVELMLLFPPIPVKAKYLVLGYLAYEIYALWQNMPTDNIAHLAHLGGAVIGFILVKAWGAGNGHQRP